MTTLDSPPPAGFGWDENSALVPIVQPVDVEPSPESIKADVVQIVGSATRDIFAWTWLTDTGRRRSFEAASLRWTVATALFHPELLDNLSFAEIGKEYGLSRKEVSKLSVQLQGILGIRFSRGFTDSHRKAISKALKKRNKKAPLAGEAKTNNDEPQ